VDVPAVQFFDGYPALFGEPFKDGIGHPQGSPRDLGHIPLAQRGILPGRIVYVFQNNVFSIRGFGIHGFYSVPLVIFDIGLPYPALIPKKNMQKYTHPRVICGRNTLYDITWFVQLLNNILHFCGKFNQKEPKAAVPARPGRVREGRRLIRQLHDAGFNKIEHL
jgi:hypothetical protein